MNCWVCSREVRGFGQLDIRFQTADPRRYPRDWVFCSRRCQDAFYRLYSVWVDTQPLQQEVFMIDPSDMEMASMRKCLKAFGEAAGEIGFQRPLGTYSEEEALQVIKAIVSCFTQAMAGAYEATQFPPICSREAPRIAPIPDLKDDLPW